MTIRRIFWEAPADTDVEGFNVYIDKAGEDLTTKILAGIAPQVIAVSVPEFRFDDDGDEILETDGLYQFAVTAIDAGGKESRVPYQHPGWVSVRIDAPPGPCLGGGIENVS